MQSEFNIRGYSKDTWLNRNNVVGISVSKIHFAWWHNKLQKRRFYWLNQQDSLHKKTLWCVVTADFWQHSSSTHRGTGIHPQRAESISLEFTPDHSRVDSLLISLLPETDTSEASLTTSHTENRHTHEHKHTRTRVLPCVHGHMLSHVHNKTLNCTRKENAGTFPHDFTTISSMM